MIIPFRVPLIRYIQMAPMETLGIKQPDPARFLNRLRILDIVEPTEDDDLAVNDDSRVPCAQRGNVVAVAGYSGNGMIL